MKTGPAGIALIKRNEGCELTAYLDRIADPPVWTIGYGDTQNVRAGMRITQQEAEERLARRLAREFEPGVLDSLQGAPVTQEQFDAMVSLAWNIGIGRHDKPDTPQDEGAGFKDSSVARHHRNGDYQQAADAFRLWNRAGGRIISGLVRRREEERRLYLSGIPKEAPETAASNCEIGAAIEAFEAKARSLQILLKAGGYYAGVIDGDFGPMSRAALADYKTRLNPT